MTQTKQINEAREQNLWGETAVIGEIKRKYEC